MPQPTLSDVHVNRPLTQLSVGYLQAQTDFVADRVFPAIPVVSKSDDYFKYNRGDFFRNTMQKRAPGTPAAGGGYKLTTAQYSAEVWAVKKIVDDQTRANSDSPLQPDKDATSWLVQQALLNREVNFASNYFGSGIWGTDIIGASSASAGHTVYWTSTSTPVQDVLTGQLAIKKATGFWPNTLVLGAETYFGLLTNQDIIDRLKYGQTAPGPVIVTANVLAQLFNVDRVLVMSGIQTTSQENTYTDSDDGHDTFDFIGGKNALLCYAAPSPGLLVPSAGYTFNWTGLKGNTAAGWRIKSFRWEIDAADHIEIEQAYSQKLVSKYLGYFFSGIVQ